MFRKIPHSLRMLSLIALSAAALFSCTAGKIENETQPAETEPVKIYTAEDLSEIVMTLDKTEVTYGVGDIIKITAVGYAEDGTVIPDIDFDYYSDDKQLASGYFAPAKTGVTKLQVKYGSIGSNAIEVDSHDPYPTSVDFSFKEHEVIIGSNVTFNINAASEYGRAKTKDAEVTVDGVTKKYTTYKMEEEGVHEAYVSIGDYQSPVKAFAVIKRDKYDLILKSDKDSVKVGERVTFTKTALSLLTGRDITSGTPTLRMCGAGEIEGSEYTFTEAGIYSFYLEYNGEVSETVVVTVENESAAEGEENGFDGYPTDLPAIIIDTYGRGINGMKRIPCTVSVYGNKGGGVEEGQLPDIVTLGEIKFRGQSSAGFPKKQYSLHTINEDGSNNNIKLLDMPKENDWVLNGSYADKSLIRNGLVQTMLSDVMDYTCRTEYCEVYLRKDNGSLDYVGVYTLVESIKIDKDRVDIEELTEDDNRRPEVTGGYIVSIDKLKGDENTVDTSLGTWTVVSPSADKITRYQDTYISDFLKDFSTTLRSDKRSNEMVGLRSYIDETSVAAPLLITELVKNIDGFAISTYFHMDREGLLKYGPGWDYDLTFGNADYNDGVNPEGWYVLSYTSFARNMTRDADFAQLLVDTWKELRADLLSDENLEKYIDDQVYLVGDAAIARSCARWPNHWDGNYVWPNHNYGKYFTQNHSEEIEKMRTFVLARAEWMDKHIEEIKTLN